MNVFPIIVSWFLFLGIGSEGKRNFEDISDSVTVDAEEQVTRGNEATNPVNVLPPRIKRQFVSVTGIGQFPGFPPGWPFEVQTQPLPTAMPPIQTKPQQLPFPSQKPPTPVPEECKTVRGEKGRCMTLPKCYPVLYSADEQNDTNVPLTPRNPALAEILRSQVSGPCDAPGEIVNQFLFRADAAFRRKLICCPVETQQRPSPPSQPTTSTTVRPPYHTTTVRYFPQQMRPFGHRPPISAPGQLKTTTAQPIVGSSCGIPKIVGGVETVAGKYPWMVALMNGQKQFCGGSLIDNQHILTAAHCVSHMRSQDVARVRVLLGAHNIHQTSPTTIVKKVARLVRHRFFSHQTLHNDVAVMKLDSPVKFSDYISPICLARGQNRFANHEAVVAGWGSVSEHGGQPATLREVKIDVWPNEKCKGKYGHMAPGGIQDHMMCAGSFSRDACRGDSGGPLMSHTGNYFEQIGIVSWGIGCGRYPGVYSRVTDFLGWITKNIL